MSETQPYHLTTSRGAPSSPSGNTGDGFASVSEVILTHSDSDHFIAKYTIHRDGGPLGVTTQSDDRLTASFFKKLNPDAGYGRISSIIDDVVNRLLDCEELLKSGQNLESDDKFMSVKPLVAELFMHRDVSEAVALLSTTSLQAIAACSAVTDSPKLPETMRRALIRLNAAPFMEYGSACELSDAIEAVSTPFALPGYNEISSELIADANFSK
jgi:hypothetical protein